MLHRRGGDRVAAHPAAGVGAIPAEVSDGLTGFEHGRGDTEERLFCGAAGAVAAGLATAVGGDAFLRSASSCLYQPEIKLNDLAANDFSREILDDQVPGGRGVARP